MTNINTIFYFPSSLAQYEADSALENINARTIAFIPPAAGETTGSIYKNGVKYGMASDEDIRNAISRIFGNDLNHGILPIATNENVGVMQAGKGLSVNASGTVNVDFSNLEQNEEVNGLDDLVAYILDHDIDCLATKNKFGAIKPGKGIGITDGVIRIDTSDLTEQELAALKGPQGEPGRDGEDGNPGTPGTDGVGIRRIIKTGTSGLVDTYSIEYTNNNTTTFTVTNGANGANGQDGRNGTNGQDGQNGTDGRGIRSIYKSGANGLVDTYTIEYTDGSASGAFTVTNGRNGVDGGTADVNEELEKVYLQDSTGSSNQDTTLKLSINKNDGTQEEPEPWSISEISITSATTTKAGLMSASDKTKLNGIESGAQAHVAPTAQEVKTALGTGNGTIKFLREDGTWAAPTTSASVSQIQADWNQSNNSEVDYIKNKPTTMGASGSSHKGGLVPDTPSTAGTSKFLREDGTWSTPGGVTLDAVLNDESTNGIQNKPVADAISALLSRLSEVEEWVGKHTDPEYDTILDEVITEFNDTLSEISGAPLIKTADNNGDGSLLSYLKEYYNAAKSVFSAASSPLFDIDTYPEVVDVDGLRGDDVSKKDLTFKAMISWLFAMCLTELMPSSGTTTNNQTKFFKTAWDLADGDTTSLYGNYDVHADPMIGRIAAGAVYAYIRGKKSYNDVQTLRQSLGFNAITASTSFDSASYGRHAAISALGYQGSKFESPTSVGYLVNTALIIPVAPGPYANHYDVDRAVPYGSGKQSAEDFYTSVPSGGHDWWLHNYKVDVSVDDSVVDDYNLSSTEKGKRDMVVYGAAMSWATAAAFFGTRKVKQDTTETTYRKFDLAGSNESGDNVYSIVGPFAKFENKTINSYATSSTDAGITSTMIFLQNVANLADDCRYPTQGPNFGRRRPLGGYNGGPIGTYACDARVNNDWTDTLNGISIGQVVRFFADESGQFAGPGSWGDYTVSEYDFPHDAANSYPSGHTAQAFTYALLLSQMRASNLSDYTEVADLIKNAYKFSTARSVLRFHWNSDLVYGRLFGTFILPIINAMSSIQIPYDNAKNAINGGSTPSQGGTATVQYNSYYEGGGSPASSDSITINVHNDSGSAVTFTMIQFLFQNEIIASGGFEIGDTIANGGTSSLSWTLNSFNLGKIGKTLNKPQIYVNGEYVDCNAFSSGTFEAGATYDIYYGGSTASTVTSGGGGGGSSVVSTTKLKLIINNNSGSTLTAANQLNFLVTESNTTVKVGRITLDNNINIATGQSGTYIGTLGDSSHVGSPFSSTYVAYGDDFGSNIILYDSNNIALYNLNLPSLDPANAASGFQPGATYTINYGGSTIPAPSPTPSSHVKVNVRVKSSVNAKSTGELKFYIDALPGQTYDHIGVVLNLPNASTSAPYSQVYTFNSGYDQTFSNVEWVEDDGSNYVGQNLTGEAPIIYDVSDDGHGGFDTDYHSSSHIGATITGPALQDGATYTIEIGSYNFPSGT